MEDGFRLQDSIVGIVGLGLMGGSLAMNLKGKCARLIGFDPHLPTIQLALANSIVDHASTSFPFPAGREGSEEEINLLIVAAPVPSIIELLRQLPAFITRPCVVLDLGSTKRDILQAMSALPENFDPIGGHPICGKEKLGLENADVNLYKDAPFVITPLERTTQCAVRITNELISTIGAHPIEMTAEEHDRVFASTSHLPFLIASSLSRSTPQDFSPFIGPGFRSTSRLAGTPPQIMMGILKSNRDNVLNAFRSFRASLDEIEAALLNEDFTELENILNQSRSNYLAVVEGDR
ncbi:MAG: prephenate dehydrogenase [Anaerolineales bacterium]|nr:prephenate dehydrogenase [Anaerolineales bacterium]